MPAPEDFGIKKLKVRGGVARNEVAGKNRLREVSAIKEIAWQLPLGPHGP